jgi:hypothetical protein
MTKEQLETNLAALKLLQEEANDKLTDHKVQISLLEKQLEDLDKPGITSGLMEKISNAIETAIEDFDFSDDDNYNREFEIDYDDRVRLSNIEFTNSCDLVEEISEKVLDLFREIEDENDTTEEEINTESTITRDYE